jgi:predicted ester cyclase
VTGRKTLRGTHKGELMGIPPTGKTVDIEVIDILAVKDGKITDHWNLVDQLGLLKQLGALPGEEAARA